jgi:predicted RNase H-like HicB family nuclease
LILHCLKVVRTWFLENPANGFVHKAIYLFSSVKLLFYYKVSGEYMSRRFNIIIENDEFGFYGYCPELEGCQTQGGTLDETLRNMKEAIELYLETLSEEEKAGILSKDIILASYEVKVA